MSDFSRIRKQHALRMYAECKRNGQRQSHTDTYPSTCLWLLAMLLAASLMLIISQWASM